MDRVTDDYPVLIAPGQPNLRVNVTVEEVFKYSPKRVDVINLETNAFETVDVAELLRSCGAQYPQILNWSRWWITTGSSSPSDRCPTSALRMRFSPLRD